MKRWLSILWVAFALASHIFAAEAGKVFRVADYGATGDGVTDDATAIRAAIAAAVQVGSDATVLFEAKRYRVSAEAEGNGKYCFGLDRATGITLQGVAGQTELISSSPRAGMMSFRSCTNVHIKGIVIDYDPVPFIQGGIVAVDVELGSFELQVDEGYPEPQPELMNHKWGVVIDRQTRRFKPGTPSHLPIRTFTALGGRRWRLELENHTYAKMMSVGDAFAMRGGAEGHGVAFWGCNGGSVEDVTMYAAPSLCMAFVQCEGDLAVQRVTVRPRPGTTRLLSGNADGIHCQMLRKGLLVEDCHFEGMTDDGMNTYDRVRMVTEIVSPTELRVHQTFDMRPGDRIQVMDPTSGFVRGESTVASIAGKLIRLDSPIENVRTSTNILTGITSMNNHLDADVVFNLSTCGAGYIIRNNYFGNFRGRGLILRGVNGLIESNVFERTSGPGIVIANEPQWPEGPMPRDIVIRGNQLRNVGIDAHAQSYGAIMVTGLGLKGFAPSPVINNIRIENNVITDPPAQGIIIESCNGVVLTDNRIAADASRTFPSSNGVGISGSSNVVVSGLIMNDTRPKTIAGIVIGATVAAGEGGVKFSDFTADLPPTATPVLDRRITK
ncbi:MAG: right-handed parallel beta-helix repeat-containing protein [Kiritimatiellales bacterium]|nr:right-handed parallel beta-helix repeat-containing protein [Kiritimatiellales bacterium]